MEVCPLILRHVLKSSFQNRGKYKGPLPRCTSTIIEEEKKATIWTPVCCGCLPSLEIIAVIGWWSPLKLAFNGE